MLTSFSVWILNTINYQLKFTAFAVEHNINIMCLQEHWYYHSELELNHHVTGNTWIFVSSSMRKNLVNATIRGVGTLLNTRAINSPLGKILMARNTGVQSKVELYQRLKKWYLMPPFLMLSIIRYGSGVKYNNPGKGVAPTPTVVVDNEKGTFGSPSTQVADLIYL